MAEEQVQSMGVEAQSEEAAKTVQEATIDVDAESPIVSSQEYISDDVLMKHVKRQAAILRDSLEDRWVLTPSVSEISLAYEKLLFAPLKPPAKKDNGTPEPNPRLNFYPTFLVPETLATYHLFFQNQPIPLSCKANRPDCNKTFRLRHGATLPDFPTLEETNKIFEGLGDVPLAANALQNENSKLVELKEDSPRMAVLKRNCALSHFAYPALNLPPKIMKILINELIMKESKPDTDDENGPVVSDEQLSRWLKISNNEDIEEKRKIMLAAVMISTLMQSLKRFFTTKFMIKKIGECMHYMFKHGYVKQAEKISNVDLSNIVSYLGVLHENRIGQSILHTTLKGDNRLDYIRDTIFLYLIYTWQTAMGIWQQCLEENNLVELRKILRKGLKEIWTSFDEETTAKLLSDIVFPDKIVTTLQHGLPDLCSQSMIQNFRNFVLERSAILPCFVSALPSDFVPLRFKESPPPLWSYTYLLQLANYIMYHNDLHSEDEQQGLMECYCRCNLCSPHRCLATNPALLNETQLIGTFEIQGPPKEDGSTSGSLKLTAGSWTSAFLKKFEEKDYYPFKINYYEDRSNVSLVEPSACIINQTQILAQLHEIKKAREEFLLKKGRGVYLDPQTGEELGANTSTVNAHSHERSSRKPDRVRGRTSVHRRRSGGTRARSPKNAQMGSDER